MEKTIKIGNQSVRLNNNVGWTIAYRDQFGSDIIPTLMPMIAGAMDIFAGLINGTGKVDNITFDDIAALMDGDALLNAVIHLGGLEFVDFVYITWSLAKCADEDIPEPKEWVKQFDSFPLDVVGPAIYELVLKGLISSKNLKRLKELKKRLQPITKTTESHSTTLSSPDSNEDSQ